MHKTSAEGEILSCGQKEIPDRQRGQAIFWTSCNQLTGKTKKGTNF